MPHTVKKVGVVGYGQMGRGIVQVSAEAGYQVKVTDKGDGLLHAGTAFVESVLARDVSKGKLAAKDRDAIIGRIAATTDLALLSECDIVIEAVAEDIELKKSVFSRLDQACSPHTILASNTSCLSIIEIASATRRLDRVVGMHFTNPVPVNRLVELVRSIATSDETAATAAEFARSLGQTVVFAQDTPGFVSNRFMFSYLIQAVRMLEAGIGSREDIDTVAVKGSRHPLGPFALLDFIGIDTAYLIASSMYEALKDPVYAPPPLLKQMVAAGWLGRKSGKGFYEYK